MNSNTIRISIVAFLCSIICNSYCQSSTPDLFQIITIIDNCCVSELIDHYGFIGSGTVSESYYRDYTSGSWFDVSFENGKIKYYCKKSRTPSNGYNDYRENTESRSFNYSDGFVVNGHETILIGKDNRYKFKTIFYLNDTSAYKLIGDNDTIFYWFSDEHICIKYPWADDIRNTEMWLKDGLPIIIKSNRYNRDRKEMHYRYTEFDEKGNWIKREQINDKGDVISVKTRNINYNLHYN